MSLTSLFERWSLRTAVAAGGVSVGPQCGPSPLTLVAQAPFMALAAIPRLLAAEQERWFAWGVVGFVGGAALYFEWPDEPSLWLALGVAAAGIAVGVLGRWHTNVVVRFACAIVAMAAFGFAAGKLRTESIGAPIVHHDFGPVWIDGRIESIENLGNGRARFVIMPTRVGRDTDNLPRRLRISLKENKVPPGMLPGTWYSVLAMVRAPPEPALPHGYDFARSAYFSGIGGVGFMLGAPKPIAGAGETWWQDFTDWVEQLRIAMTARIMAALPNKDGPIAAALITGERGPITDEDTAAYRDSGLQHVLSISGVHMALAGLGIFWLIRAILALFPAIALHYPIKKWAALAALASSTFYLMISGASAPPVRSYIMLTCMLLAVLVDRPALSMRAVALSALIIVALQPESVTEPGFQMSFGAIIGLIALAEWQAKRPRRETPSTRLGRWFERSRKYLIGGLVTSLVATVATVPFAMFHFDRAGGYSLVSNLLAMPVVGIVIMPMAALAVFLMPFHLEYWPLQAMGWGVHAMTDIAYWTAGLPGAVTLVRAWPAAALGLVTLGSLWIALWQRGWRWAGLLPAAIGLAIAFTVTPPDLIVAHDAHALAFRGADGRLALLGKIDDYTAQQWLLRDGDTRDPKAWLAAPAGRCDEWGCVARLPDGRNIALSLRAGAVADDCARAAIVVAAVPIRQQCRQAEITLDRLDVARGGALSVWLGVPVHRESVAEIRGKRPWSTAD